MGWPLDDKTGGGSFIYHFGDNLVSVGFVVHLNYANPYLSPVRRVPALQDPSLDRAHLEGGKRIAYGARAITEGGLQSIPKLAFPGGALIGCAAGFVNVPRIKGSHNAMLSGMLAAEAAFAAIGAAARATMLDAYAQAVSSASIGQGAEARPQRQAALVALRHACSASLLGGIDMWLNTLFRVPRLGTLQALQARLRDARSRRPTRKPIDYPKPDGVISFDMLSSVFLSNTNHDENQPVHLQARRSVDPDRA